MAAFLQDHFVDDQALLLPFQDLGVSRGLAVFDYLVVEDGVPMFLNQHLERLLQSAKGLNLQHSYDLAALRSIVQQLIQHTPEPLADIKLMMTGGPSENMLPEAPATLMAFCKPFSKSPLPEGIHAMTYHYLRDLPTVKHTNYLMAIWLQPKLKAQGLQDVLYLHDGLVTEFPRASAFMVTRDGVLVTPSDKVLAGITRGQLLGLAADLMPVEIRPVTVEEWMHAAEVFMTSTSKMVTPVLSIDGISFNHGKPGPVTMRLKAVFVQHRKRYKATFRW